MIQMYRIVVHRREDRQAVSWPLPHRRMKKIALEEHFLAPGFEPYWLKTVEDVAPERYQQVLARLYDLGEQRLAAMETTGIEVSVLSIAGPGVQIEPDAAK